jgi:hypothetical protein
MPYNANATLKVKEFRGSSKRNILCIFREIWLILVFEKSLPFFRFLW